MEQQNLVAKRGDTFTRTIYFTENNVATDITGWTVFFTVKEKIDDTDENAVIKKTITNHTDATNGETVINIAPEDTNLVGNFIYDIQIKKANGDIITILEGNINFAKDITQRTS